MNFPLELTFSLPLITFRIMPLLLQVLDSMEFESWISK